MRNLAQGILRFFIRVSAFIRKELFEILRQTRLVVTLILGPFLILLLFGIGYRDEPRTLRALFVLPEGSGLEAQVEAFADSLGPNIEYAGITYSASEADRLLRRQEVDLVVVAPPDPMAEVRNNRQAIFNLYHYEIDPFEEIYINAVGQIYVDEVNRRILQAVAEEGKVEAASLQEEIGSAREHARAMRRALEGGNNTLARQEHEALTQDINLLTLAVGSSLAIFQGVQQGLDSNPAMEVASIGDTLAGIQETLQTLGSIGLGQDDFTEAAETAVAVEEQLAALDDLLDQFHRIDSFVLIRPFGSETLSITNVALQPTHFYAPAVIALLLQHVAVTIAALSFIRERMAGTMELFRIAPVSAFEMLLGKYISYLLLTGVLALILTLLIIFGLGVPLLGPWSHYAVAIVWLLGASLGVGFVISLTARTDSQAVQYAMIMLLSSVFFSGFFLALYRLWEPVRLVSWFLPATYGTSLLQSIMLRGQTANIPLLFFLSVFSLALFLYAWWRLRLLMVQET